MLVRSTLKRNGSSFRRKNNVSFVPTDRSTVTHSVTLQPFWGTVIIKWSSWRTAPSDASSRETLCSLWRSTRCSCSTWCLSSSCFWSGCRASCTTCQHHDDTPGSTARIPTLSTTWPQSPARRTAMHLLTTSSRGTPRQHVRPHSVSCLVSQPRGELTYVIPCLTL